MASVVVTLKIMPESPEVKLDEIQKKVEEQVKNFGGDVAKTETEPIAFGLNALNVMFIMDESKGSTEPLEKEVNMIDGVSSAEIVDVRRAVG